MRVSNSKTLSFIGKRHKGKKGIMLPKARIRSWSKSHCRVTTRGRKEKEKYFEFSPPSALQSLAIISISQTPQEVSLYGRQECSLPEPALHLPCFISSQLLILHSRADLDKHNQWTNGKWVQDWHQYHSYSFYSK